MGVEQTEIGALPQLRAGAVGGIADEQHRPIVPARQGDMAVGRARKGVGSGGMVDDGGGLGPQRARGAAPG